MTGGPSALRTGTCLYFCAVVGLAAVRFASTPERFLDQVFLLLLVPALVAVWNLSVVDGDWRFLLLALSGAFVLANAALRPALEAQGYVLAAVAWSGLVATLWLASDERSARILMFFLIGLGAFEAAYGLLQAVGGFDQIGGYDRDLGRLATGTFINRNHFAGLLNMEIGLATGVLYTGFSLRRAKGRSETYAWTWLVIMASAVLGLAMALSLSRAGALVMIGMMSFVALLLRWRRRRRSGRRGLPARVAAILLTVMVALITAFGADALIGRFEEVESDDRPQVYHDTLALIADHPWFGVGPGMYRWHFRPYQTASVDKVFSHAHNDYLQAAAEWGVPVALALWGLVAWRFYRAIRLFLRARHPLQAGIGLGCAAAILSILLHSLLDFNLQIPANLLVFSSILGIGWATERGARLEREPPRSERR